MKALVYNGVNSYPDYVEVDVKPTPDQVKVDLQASALNHRDVWILKGKYADLTEGAIMGADGVGTYNGKEVILYPGLDWGNNEEVMSKRFRVLGMPSHGTFSSQIFIKPEYIFNKPTHLKVKEAAALPLAGLTAYRALVVKGKAKKGQNVLISGIGGGVALMAFQFALALGCNVFVTSGSDEKIDKAIALGATQGFNYKSEKWYKKVQAVCDGIDLTIDSAGGNGFNDFLKLANPGGRIVTYGGTAGPISNLSPQILFWKQLYILGSTMGSLTDFKNMLSFVNDFKVRPVVDHIFDFNEYQAAFDLMRSGNQFGKIVLKHH